MKATYKDVKLMVKVKLMEKSVNNHVGKVYVTQYRIVGSTLKMDRITRPSRPKLVEGVVVSAGFIPSTEFDRASAVLYTAALETSASDRDVAVPAVAMVGDDGQQTGMITSSSLPTSQYSPERQNSHDMPFCAHVGIREYIREYVLERGRMAYPGMWGSRQLVKGGPCVC